MRIEEELGKRKLEDIPTARLFTLAGWMREKINREIGSTDFSETTKRIPQEEFIVDRQKWNR
jgi:hypothetical protein